MSVIIKQTTCMYQCHDCGNRFSQPHFWIVENAQGYPLKIFYCPECVSQNIERVEHT